MNEQGAVYKCFGFGAGCKWLPQVPVTDIVDQGPVKDVFALMGMKPINIKGKQVMMDGGMAQDLVDFAEYGKEVLSTRGTQHSPVSTTKDMEDQIVRIYKLLVPDDPASDLQKQQAANIVDKALKDTSSSLKKATQATLEKVRSTWSMGHAIDRAIRYGEVSDAALELAAAQLDLATPDEVLPLINSMIKDFGPKAMADELNSRLQAATAPSDEEIANQQFLRDMAVKAIVGTGLAVAGATMYVATGGQLPQLPQGVQNLVRIPRGIFRYLDDIRPDLREDFEIAIGEAMAIAVPVAQEAPAVRLGGAITRSLANGPQANPLEAVTDAISEAIQDVNEHPPQTWDDVARAFDVIRDAMPEGGGGGTGETGTGIGIGVIGTGMGYLIKILGGRVLDEVARASTNIGLEALGVSNPFARFVAVAVTSRIAEHYLLSKEAAHPRGYFPLSLEDDLQYTQNEINAAIGDPGQVLRLNRLMAHEELLKSIISTIPPLQQVPTPTDATAWDPRSFTEPRPQSEANGWIPLPPTPPPQGKVPTTMGGSSTSTNPPVPSTSGLPPPQVKTPTDATAWDPRSFTEPRPQSEPNGWTPLPPTPPPQGKVPTTMGGSSNSTNPPVPNTSGLPPPIPPQGKVSDGAPKKFKHLTREQFLRRMDVPLDPWLIRSTAAGGSGGDGGSGGSWKGKNSGGGPDPSWLERLMKILSTGAHLVAAAAATSAGVVWTATKAAAIGTAGAAVVGTAAATGIAAASALRKTTSKTKTKTETRCGCCTQTVRITIEAYE